MIYLDNQEEIEKVKQENDYIIEMRTKSNISGRESSMMIVLNKDDFTGNLEEDHKAIERKMKGFGMIRGFILHQDEGYTHD